MTNLIITSLQELSWLTAMKVIGWKLEKVDDFGGWMPSQEWYHPTKGAGASWHYAQDMADAFEVVEHLWQQKRKPLSLTYQNNLDEPFNKFFWSATFRGSANGFGYAETPAAAICLAALRSLDIEVDLRLKSDHISSNTY